MFLSRRRQSDPPVQLAYFLLRNGSLCCVYGYLNVPSTATVAKQQYAQHKLSLRNKKYANRTELAKHNWKLKENKENYKISWSINSSASAYNNISKRCSLCLTEKLHIIKADKASNLNKRTELISKSPHKNKYFLKNIDLRLQQIH